MDKETLTLIRDAKRNPYRFFRQDEVGLIFGFGRNVMSALASMGAPVVGRKCNPAMLYKWLEANADKVGKIRGE